MKYEEKVGFIGLGIMGAAMARNLCKAGFAPVVWNRTPGKAEALAAAGAVIADSPEAVARASSVVVTMVTDTPDLIEVVEGPKGVVQGAKKGTVLIDMSSVSPRATRDLATRLKGIGVSMMDAPVSGGSWGAEQGTLSIMVGGDDQDFKKCLPIFEAMGQRITHMGPIGMGQITKLVNQVLVVGTCAAVAEALTFATVHEADLAKTIDAVSQGAAGSWQLQNLGPRMIQDDFEPGFMVKLQQKDLRLIMEAAQEHNMPLPVASLVRQFYTALEAAGHGEQGTQALVKIFKTLAGLRSPGQ